MKWLANPLVAASLAISVYLLCYAGLRISCHSTATVSTLPANRNKGGFNVQQRSVTKIVIPSGGFSRQLKLALYWGYYLPGQVDHLITGRDFWKWDEATVLVFP
jgi:hypothetical protein